MVTITRVASGSANSAGHTGLSASSFTPTAGATLVATFLTFAAAQRSMSMFDNVGGNDTWTRLGTGYYNGTSTTQLEAFVLENAAAASTEARIVSAAGTFDYPSLEVFEVTGLAATGKVLDYLFLRQGAVGTGTDAVTPGTCASQSADRTVLAVAWDDDGLATDVPDAGTNYTSVATVGDYGGGATGRAIKRDYTGTSSDSATWTNVSGSSKNYSSIAISLKADAAGIPMAILQRYASLRRQ